jgi:hypothetical protein
MTSSSRQAALVALLAVAGLTSAMASSIPLSYTTTSAGTTGVDANSLLAVPGSYTYGNTFSAGAGQTAVAGTAAGFFDDYIFTISAATADSITSSITLPGTLEIDGLQATLFSYSAGETIPLFVSNLPPGGTEIGGWSTAFNSGGASGSVTVIPTTTLTAGTYALEIKGTVSGSAGGSYSGVLDAEPASVPLPAALPLLLSGLGGLGLWSRRRC